MGIFGRFLFRFLNYYPTTALQIVVLLSAWLVAVAVLWLWVDWPFGLICLVAAVASVVASVPITFGIVWGATRNGVDPDSMWFFGIAERMEEVSGRLSEQFYEDTKDNPTLR